MTAEKWLFWSGAATALFTVLAAVTGITTWYLSEKVGAAKDAELDRVKAQLAPRILAVEQEGSIALALARFRGERIDVFTVTGNAEIFEFGNRIGRALEGAGLKVQRGDGTASANAHRGISLAVGASRSDLGAALQTVFVQAGLTNSIAIEPHRDPNTLIVLVWPK